MQPVILDWISNLFFFKGVTQGQYRANREYLNMKCIQDNSKGSVFNFPSVILHHGYAGYFLSIRNKNS